MPSKNDNIIGKLRRKYEPHMQLSAKVDLNHNIIHAIEGKLEDLPKIHKTLSKSFGMQRKTLMRVLALEKQVAELRQEKQTPEQDIGDWADESAEWDRSGGASSTKDPGYASRVMGKDASGEYLSPSARKLAFKRKKISASAFKKGSSVGGAQKVAADTTGASALAIRKPSAAGVTPGDVTPEEEKGGALAKPTESLIGPLKTIDNSVNSIVETLKVSNKADAKAQSDARKQAEKDARAAKEGKLEGIKEKLSGAAETVLKPVKNIFQKIWDFLKIVFLGRVIMKLFDWFANPANGEKVASLFRFLKDWWPVLVAGIMAVVGPGMIFTAGLIALLVWGVPKIIEAVKWVGSLFGIGVDKELKTIEDNAAKTGDDLAETMDKDLTKDTESTLNNNKGEVSDTQTEEGSPSTDTTPAQVSETQQQAKDVKSGADQVGTLPTKMASGGVVPGSGNRDTVPAMLTPGEFVMSKGAVQQYGANTLAGMNAAAGGTNRPTVGRYNGGGSVRNVSNISSSSFKNVSNTSSGGMSFGGPKIHYSGGGFVNSIKGNTINVPQKIIPTQPLHFAGGGPVPEAQIVRSSPSQIVINPPPPSSSSVVVEDAVADASARLGTKGAPNQELPRFSATKMRSLSKIKTLGIVV